MQEVQETKKSLNKIYLVPEVCAAALENRVERCYVFWALAKEINFQNRGPGIIFYDELYELVVNDLKLCCKKTFDKAVDDGADIFWMTHVGKRNFIRGKNIPCRGRKLLKLVGFRNIVDHYEIRYLSTAQTVVIPIKTKLGLLRSLLCMVATSKYKGIIRSRKYIMNAIQRSRSTTKRYDKKSGVVLTKNWSVEKTGKITIITQRPNTRYNSAEPKRLFQVSKYRRECSNSPEQLVRDVCQHRRYFTRLEDIVNTAKLLAKYNLCFSDTPLLLRHSINGYKSTDGQRAMLSHSLDKKIFQDQPIKVVSFFKPITTQDFTKDMKGIEHSWVKALLPRPLSYANSYR